MPLSRSSNSFVCATLVALCLANGAAHAGSIGHNKVVGFKQDITNYQWKFQPMLKVSHGCVPFPAVDRWGNTSGGLEPTGTHNGKCSRSDGQVYVRAYKYNGDCAVMYAWYFPKDHQFGGHRHDWENIVVWLSECTTNARIKAISYSAHGKYEKYTKFPLWGGSHPRVDYGTNGFLNHALKPTGATGGWQPAIRYWGMPVAARLALAYTSFGQAQVPFIDQYYFANLAKAYYR